MLLNIPSVSADVTNVPKARKASSSFQGLLSSDSITTETHKHQMENWNLCALALNCCSGSTIMNCKICLNSAHRVNLSSTIMIACFLTEAGNNQRDSSGPWYSSPKPSPPSSLSLFFLTSNLLKVLYAELWNFQEHIYPGTQQLVEKQFLL